MNIITVVVIVGVVALVTRTTAALGAGRAFPIHAENYAIEKFQTINPSLEWDPTNFLVDKSGFFASCDQIRRGYEMIKDVTPDGRSIGVVYDHVTGAGVDVESVNKYIRLIIDDWMFSGEHKTTILNADRFGCSVRPGCSDQVAVACLFSPASDDDYYDDEEQENPPQPIQQYGQAFTKEQYELAEYITGHKWDRSHFLENLAGMEITCSMLGIPNWPFLNSIQLAKEYGMNVMGVKGEAPNLGSTQQAMEKILWGFKSIRSTTSVGCSVIPDCTSGRGDLADEMWVIVTCIYEEEF